MKFVAVMFPVEDLYVVVGMIRVSRYAGLLVIGERVGKTP